MATYTPEQEAIRQKRMAVLRMSHDVDAVSMALDALRNAEYDGNLPEYEYHSSRPSTKQALSVKTYLIDLRHQLNQAIDETQEALGPNRLY